MKTFRRFTPEDSMVDLIKEDYNLLPLLSRFSIPLGFGNNTVGQTCENAGISTSLFLLVINFTVSGELDTKFIGDIDAEGIVDFLHNSHKYFLSYKIPHIRANLIGALDGSHNDINPIILDFFDNFVEQVREHFEYEEGTVFPYIRNLLAGIASDYSIDIFRHNHHEVGETLSELKNLILRYYTTSMPDVMYDALVDICNCEEDLESHSTIENNVLIPLIDHVESTRNQRKSS